MADYSWVNGMKEQLSQKGQKGTGISKALDHELEFGRRPIDHVEFVRTERNKYVGEVAKTDGDFVYHFYPMGRFPANFEDHMGNAFISVFKDETRLMANFVDMMGAWAVCAKGYANNILADELALSVFDKLDDMLA